MKKRKKRKLLLRSLSLSDFRGPGLGDGRLQYYTQRLTIIGRKKNTPLISKIEVNRDGTSHVARQYLKNSIAQGLTGPALTVQPQTATDANGQTMPSQGGGAVININPNDVNNTTFSPSLQRLSYGFGMLFLHEMGHTRFGGNLQDGPPGMRTWGQVNGGITTTPATPVQFTRPGPVENIMNKIRRQLGPGFGQRLSYLDYMPGGFIPFDRSALRALQTGSALPAGSLWIR